MSGLEQELIESGRIIKASLLADLSSLIELFLRDEIAFTAVSLLNASFDAHYFCLICALSDHPFHDHLSEEPEIWEHIELIPMMESAIVSFFEKKGKGKYNEKNVACYRRGVAGK